MYSGYSNGQTDKARSLIKNALAHGYCVSVGDGEGGWLVKCSTDEKEILLNVGEMDCDELVFRDANNRKEKKGWVLLVWGNAQDGSELIADYSSNVDMERLVLSS